MQSLVGAILTGDVAALQRLLDADPAAARRRLPPEASETGIGGATPLHLAIEGRHLGVVELLLDAGADPAARNADGRTALHDAVEYGFLEAQELLIARGAEVDVCLAAILGRVERLRVLLAEDPDRVHDDSTGLSPLGWAAYGNQVEAARILLDAGARMDDGELLCAASVGHVEVGELLLDRGADVDGGCGQDGTTALHAAAAMQYTDDASRFVGMLLERGADPAARTRSGQTPLEIARRAERQHREAAPGCPKRFDRVIALLERAEGSR